MHMTGTTGFGEPDADADGAAACEETDDGWVLVHGVGAGVCFSGVGSGLVLSDDDGAGLESSDEAAGLSDEGVGLGSPDEGAGCSDEGAGFDPSLGTGAGCCEVGPEVGAGVLSLETGWAPF